MAFQIPKEKNQRSDIWDSCLSFFHQNYFQIKDRFKWKNGSIKLLEEKKWEHYRFSYYLKVGKAFLAEHNPEAKKDKSDP